MPGRKCSRHWILPAALISLSLPARASFAQAGTVTGKVTDEAGAPVSSARIVIVGTTLEIQTPVSGEYRIANVPPGRVVVRAYKLGFKSVIDTVSLDPGGTVAANFNLVASLVSLSQVVVTGTAGNQERRAQSAEVASLDASGITTSQPTITSVDNMLQSQLPGVSVSSGSGESGTAKEIRIRGASSINLSNEPIIFIDGIRVNDGFTSAGNSGQQYSRMNDLNPEEIESVEVVKGPAAATLYGADASAGVIQIITKKGHAGSNSFVQSIHISGGNIDQDWTPPANYGLCAASQIAIATSLCYGKTVGTMVSDIPLRDVHAFRMGQERQIGWNGRGGGQNYGYNLSFGQDGTNGTLPNNSFTRYNVRTNFNYVPSTKLTIDAGLSLAQSDTKLPDDDNDIYGWLGGGLLGSPLTVGVNTQNGWYGFNRQYAAISSIQREQLTHRVTTSLSANWVPVPWFTNRLTMGLDYAGDNINTYFPNNSLAWYGGNTDTGSQNETYRDQDRYTVDYLGNIRRTFGARNQWEGNLSFGIQVISTNTAQLGATGIGFITNDNNVVGAAATTTGTGSFIQQKQYGYLSQVQIGYEDRAFIQLGVRVDKNSSFGTSAPGFVLPKVGGTWVLSDEKFFSPFTNVVNSLRLRAAWGTTGRSPLPGSALYTLSTAPYNIVAGANVPGLIPGNPGNSNLKPERGTEFEAGIDASFLHDRLTGDLTYFHKATNNLIIQQPYPPSLGFNANPFVNIGSVLNEGFELTLNYDVLHMRNLDWQIRGSGNTLHNELTSLGGIAPFALGAGRTIVGQQLGVFAANKVLSVNTTTGVVYVSDSLTPVGNQLPTLEWSVTNSFTVFKDFRISALLDAKRGFSVLNETAYFRETQLVRSNARLDPTVLGPTEYLRRFGNQTPGQPSFIDSGYVAGAIGSSAHTYTVATADQDYFQPGDFVRLREVSIGYQMPPRYLNLFRNKVSGASITLALQNVKLWTRYQGPDPEVVSNPGGTAGAFSRTDFLTLPNPKQTTLRFDFSF
jgi:TonB-linked SusC/RagA family outer membrane protein